MDNCASIKFSNLLENGIKDLLFQLDHLQMVDVLPSDLFDMLHLLVEQIQSVSKAVSHFSENIQITDQLAMVNLSDQNSLSGSGGMSINVSNSPETMDLQSYGRQRAQSDPTYLPIFHHHHHHHHQPSFINAPMVSHFAHTQSSSPSSSSSRGAFSNLTNSNVEFSGFAPLSSISTSNLHPLTPFDQHHQHHQQQLANRSPILSQERVSPAQGLHSIKKQPPSPPPSSALPSSSSSITTAAATTTTVFHEWQPANSRGRPRGCSQPVPPSFMSKSEKITACGVSSSLSLPAADETSLMSPEGDGRLPYAYKKRKRSDSDSFRVCVMCKTSDTPEWRRGPKGPRTLCNACGLKWAKKLRGPEPFHSFNPSFAFDQTVSPFSMQTQEHLEGTSDPRLFQQQSPLGNTPFVSAIPSGYFAMTPNMLPSGTMFSNIQPTQTNFHENDFGNQ